MSCKRFSLLLALLACAMPALAGAPPMISYQGRLMQPSHAPVPDGTYSIQFSIYDVPTGGNLLWSETNANVLVKGGLFATMLGSVNPLPATIFDSPNRFFGVKVGGDPEMTPRQQIASVGYAVKAASADIATTVPDAAITASKLATDAVATANITNGAVTATKLAPGVAIPPGTILMWSGAVGDIPVGWALCDGGGAPARPDLRNRFVVGAGSGYAVGATGGEASHTLTVGEMPSHTHGMALYNSIQSGNQGPITMGMLHNGMNQWVGTSYDSSTGGGQAHENRPPYYALCYIMKLAY